MEKQTEAIVIKIRDKEISIGDDTPDFTELLNHVIDNRDVINLSNELEVECTKEGFDKALFKKTLVDTIDDLLNKMKLEKEKLNSRLSTLRENK